MGVQTLSLYMTDFGAVDLPARVAARIPKRKNGQFDRRFRVTRELVSRITEHAKARYLAGEGAAAPIIPYPKKR